MRDSGPERGFNQLPCSRGKRNVLVPCRQPPHGVVESSMLARVVLERMLTLVVSWNAQAGLVARGWKGNVQTREVVLTLPGH